MQLREFPVKGVPLIQVVWLNTSISCFEGTTETIPVSDMQKQPSGAEVPR